MTIFLSGISYVLLLFLVIKTQPCAFVSRLHSLYLMCLFQKKKNLTIFIFSPQNKKRKRVKKKKKKKKKGQKIFYIFLTKTTSLHSTLPPPSITLTPHINPSRKQQTETKHKQSEKKIKER